MLYVEGERISAAVGEYLLNIQDSGIRTVGDGRKTRYDSFERHLFVF
jgi:hypothetical protein